MKRNHPIDFVPENSKLTFLKLTGNKDKRGTKALYKCICGVEKELYTRNVNNAQIRGCGCLTQEQRDATGVRKTTHGLSKTHLYRIFRGIMSRCYYADSPAYKYYGEKGITVCEEWRNDFKAFYDWALANGWEKGLHIDKDIIPKKLGIPATIYSPAMCSVVSMKENMNAMSTNVTLEYLGKKQNITEWAEELGVDMRFIWARLNLGWSAERALSTPKRKIQDINFERRKVILNTETGIFYFGAKEVAAIVGISATYMNQKLLGRHPNNTPFIYV